MIIQSNTYEPKKTFQSINNDYVSKTTFRGRATQTVHYQVNGTGRDTYINKDNGGFCKMYSPYPYKYGSVGTFAPKRHHTPSAPTMHPMNVYYRSDGTGRDSYVVQTSGGFNNTGRMLHFKDAFKQSLRQYNDPRTTNHYPYVKLGGRQSGFDKALSTNTFQHFNTIVPKGPQNLENLNTDEDSPTRRNFNSTQYSGLTRKRDFLLESQLSYDYRHHVNQHQYRKVQKSMDQRLSRPKFSRGGDQLNTISN